MDQFFVISVALVTVVIICAVIILVNKRTAVSQDEGRSFGEMNDEINTLKQSLALEIQKNSRIEGLEREIESNEKAVETIREAKSKIEQDLAKTSETLHQKEDQLSTLRQELNDVRADLKALQTQHGELQADHARLKENLEQEQKQAAEKIRLLQDAKKEMSDQFRVLAEDVMKNHGETFTKQNKEQLSTLLTPLRDRLHEFEKGIRDANHKSAEERATLGEQIRQLSDTSAKMTMETSNLTRALKGKAQTQGAWGEMILTTILERSGLRKGEEYVTQESHTTEDSKRLRPDVIVNLPNDERIIIDSKVSLKAFESYVNAVNDAERATSLTRHIQSLKQHIRDLSGKEYQNKVGKGLDFVIMFVPIEGALAVALQEDPALTSRAAESHVAIATPTTLMMALRTVSSLWQVERRNQNAEAIAERAGKLYDKFAGFVNDMQALDKSLVQARDKYDNAISKLSSGRGNVMRQVEDLKAMGAKTSKSLPDEMLSDTDQNILPPQSD